MDDVRKEPQRVFENLTKNERKLLRKEFSKGVETRFKVSLWGGIGLLLIALTSGGFSVYYMLNIFLTDVVAYQIYICAAVFTIGGFVSLILTSQFHNKFRTWLRECKNIVTEADTMNKYGK